MKNALKKIKTNNGLTLPELLISTLILVTIYAGMIICYIQGMQLNNLTEHITAALTETRNQITIVENTAFDQIFATYNNTTFTINNIDGIGSISIDNSILNILTITVTYCWQENNKRLLGEDINLNGQLDGGEDLNGNSALDSPVQLITSVFNIT